MVGGEEVGETEGGERVKVKGRRRFSGRMR